MNRPAIAYVVNSLNAGGTEKLVVEMSLAYAQEYDVRVYCLDEPGLWAPRLREAGIPVHCLWRQPGIDLSVATRLASLFRAANVRIVHAHQCTAWFYAALSRLVHPAPRLLLHEHGRFWPEADHPRRRLVNATLINRLTHRFVAVSQDVAARLERYEGIPRSAIQVIYNGVTPPERGVSDEVSRLRVSLGFEPGEFVIGTVGRFDPIKNLPMLVRALQATCGVHPRVRGLLVGDGPERPAIERMLEESGLAGRVVMTGHRDDARRLVACMDLFVLASFSEGTSIALLEAMAAGVPVAVTAVGGNPEVVDSETGWVVPSDDTPALTAAFDAAITNMGLRRQRGEAARRRFDGRFAMSAMLGAYRDIYHQLMGAAQ
jgi:glycosyltransferase involved in cell wall biosynthesis